jgi:pectate lyase
MRAKPNDLEFRISNIEYRTAEVNPGASIFDILHSIFCGSKEIFLNSFNRLWFKQGSVVPIVLASPLAAMLLFFPVAKTPLANESAGSATPAGDRDAAPVSALSSLPSFPGAEGCGAFTPGSREGTVYEVTNLEDSGPGSLRDAVSQGHRTIVFRVSGTIALKNPLRVAQPFITIAGQTATGGGICLRNYTFQISTHDVIVRFIRSRLGDESRQENDSISILNGCRDVILDHCSATWSVDEGLSTSGMDSNITVQWCLIAEALDSSVHSKGAHGYGSLARASGPVTWHHNLWAHNHSRNPRLGDNYGKGAHPAFDVRNNVMYDYGDTCSGLTQGIFTVNYIGNYICPGPSSKAKFPIHIGAESDIQFYLRDNVMEGNDALTADNAKFVDALEINGKVQARIVEKPFDAPPVATGSARDAYKMVLAAVGACNPVRDSVDARIINDVMERKGKIINSQKDVGGWPDLKSAPAPADSDHDGMPDSWEIAHGFNPKDASDAQADPDKDGYTNLEEYLNGTNPNQYVDYRNPKNNTDTWTTARIKTAK